MYVGLRIQLLFLFSYSLKFCQKLPIFLAIFSNTWAFEEQHLFRGHFFMKPSSRELNLLFQKSSTIHAKYCKFILHLYCMQTILLFLRRIFPSYNRQEMLTACQENSQMESINALVCYINAIIIQLRNQGNDYTLYVYLRQI